MIFSRLAQLGLHKQLLARAGDDAAFREDQEISIVLDRVFAQKLREQKCGQDGQNCRDAGHVHTSESDRRFEQMIRAIDELEARHPEWPSPRDQALAILAREA